MSADRDPALLTISQARREIAARRLSAVELTESVIARAERLNASLVAYLHLDGDRAIAQARVADGGGRRLPLTGIQICVKDVIDVAEVPTTAGAARWRRVPERDASVVQRLRGAGAIVLGKGNTNEFAYGIDGLNPHWGNCSNPYDPARLSGGSSSGPAVATAAGMALAGLGTDTTGSIRVPASFCGLVGIRPTPGLLPLSGVVPLSWSYDTVGPLARSVEDAEIVFGVLRGEGSRAGARNDRQLSGLRVGLLEQLLDAAEPYVASGVLEAARHLETLGAELAPARLELLNYAAAVHHIVQHAEAASAHGPWFDAQRPHYSEPVRVRLDAGRLLPATAYLTAQRARRLLIREAVEKLKDVDVLLAPSAPVVAPPQDVSDVTIRGTMHDLRPALLACVLGPTELACPIVAVPVGAHDGLPYGMQVIGRPYSETLLLSLARACEARCGWPERLASHLSRT